MAYEVGISLLKSRDGAIDGVIATIAAAAVIKLVKTNLNMADMSPEVENAIAVAVGAIASAAIVAAKRFYFNWAKNKDPKKPEDPAQPAAPAAPAA